MPVTAASDPNPDDLGLKPLSARSVVLSLLLGAHPPELPVRQLIRAADDLGITEATVRVALTRMTTAGDILRTDSGYRLSERLLDRQRRQDDAIHPDTRSWRGRWELVVVTAVGRSAADRADLRAALGRLRLAELREGVWTRPDNLRRRFPAALDPFVRRFTARAEHDPDRLVHDLWDLPAWSARGHALHDHFTASTNPATRIAAAAAIVRHLLTDPVLPPLLQPPGWPADTLRATYTHYRTTLIHLAGQHTT